MFFKTSSREDGGLEGVVPSETTGISVVLDVFLAVPLVVVADGVCFTLTLESKGRVLDGKSTDMRRTGLSFAKNKQKYFHQLLHFSNVQSTSCA